MTKKEKSFDTKVSNKWTIKERVKKFDMPGGWYFVSLPKDHPALLLPRGKWGFVPITAKVGNTEWKSSLMPLGDKKNKKEKSGLFIALPEKVRKKEGIELDDRVLVSFSLL